VFVAACGVFFFNQLPNMHEPTQSEQEEFYNLLNQIPSPGQLSKQDILSSIPAKDLARIIDRIGSGLYVIITKDGKSVMKDPALRRPFSTNNLKFAESCAKEIGGIAISFNEALKIITNNNKPTD